ncbi:RNA polymerase II-associated protein 3 [Portunus trituberculatus]|uniref:RNA polymerase II-associated protein 3 n=1 Tax=Portunus trituberculatus TaxID=210409 RepID=A0A5B7DAM5_PORTR|nr:RNA polymerase II-associated protein 3 [Portunus trituberculatus]
MDRGVQSSLILQKNLKDNTEELHDFLADLKNWEKEMKEVDQRLASQSSSKDKANSDESPTAHPVRSKSHQGSAKSILKQTENNKQVEMNKQMENNKQTIMNDKNNKKNTKRLPCDYAAWDKFDVDKALQSSSSEEEKEEEKEEHKQPSPKTTPPVNILPANKKERATALKEEGNKLYSKGRLEDAVAKYTQGMALDPTNPLLPANRAMAYIKLKKYTAAEADCNRCLKLDCDYIKGYLRRATARLNLGKEELARRDCLKVLEMEPGNKEAKRELERLRGMASSREENKTSTEQEVKNNRLGKEKVAQDTPETKKEGVAAGKGNEQSEAVQATSHKRKENGKKMKIIEVNRSQEDKAPPKANQILPIVKPPHLRSKMIPPAFFRTVDLETGMLVEVAKVLLREEVSPSLAAQYLSALSVSHGFSINLMFLEADHKQDVTRITVNLSI